MRVYSLNRRKAERDEFPIVWKDGKERGAIPADELGEQLLGDRHVRGTGVDGPFRVAGERKPCEMGLVVIDGEKLRSLAANVGGPHND